MTFEDWFQLRLDSLRRQNEWRKIDCLLASKEYVRDAWEAGSTKNDEAIELGQCIGCGHLYMKPFPAQCDCLENSENKYYPWVATPKETK